MDLAPILQTVGGLILALCLYLLREMRDDLRAHSLKINTLETNHANEKDNNATFKEEIKGDIKQINEKLDTLIRKG